MRNYKESIVHDWNQINKSEFYNLKFHLQRLSQKHKIKIPEIAGIIAISNATIVRESFIIIESKLNYL